MAIAPVSGANVSQDVSYSSGVATGFAVNAGTGANRYMVAFPVIHNGGSMSWADGGQEYNGIPLTPLHAEVQDEALARPFGLVDPAANSNTFDSTLVDTFTQNPVGIVSVDVYSGVDTAGTPVDNIATATTGTDDTINITCVSAVGDVPIFMGTGEAFSPAGTAPTEYTERWENVNGELFVSGGYGTGAASVAFVGTVSSAAMIGWIGMAFNLNTGAVVPPDAPRIDYSYFPKHKIAERARGVS